MTPRSTERLEGSESDQERNWSELRIELSHQNTVPLDNAGSIIVKISVEIEE